MSQLTNSDLIFSDLNKLWSATPFFFLLIIALEYGDFWSIFEDCESVSWPCLPCIIMIYEPTLLSPTRMSVLLDESPQHSPPWPAQTLAGESRSINTPWLRQRSAENFSSSQLPTAQKAEDLYNTPAPPHWDPISASAHKCLSIQVYFQTWSPVEPLSWASLLLPLCIYISLEADATRVEPEQGAIMLTTLSLLLHAQGAHLYMCLLERRECLLLPISRKEDSVTSGSSYM